MLHSGGLTTLMIAAVVGMAANRSWTDAEGPSTVDKMPPVPAKAGFLLFALGLVSCASEPMNPSPESRFLQDRLIPHMLRWGKTKSDVLPLGPMLASQGFEKICTGIEYNPVAEFEPEVPGIKTYHGSVGHMVPESRIAIIGIKGDSAHVAYVRMIDITLRNKRPLCSGVEKAVVRRLKPTQPSGPGSIPDVLLEETE